MSGGMKSKRVNAVITCLFGLLGVGSIFCTQFFASVLCEWQKVALFAVGLVLLLVSGITMVRWCRKED